MPLTLHTVISDETIEDVVRDIMDNMPEASQSYDCVKWKYEALYFHFVDHDTGQEHIVTKKMLLGAFPLMFTDKWPKGLLPPPHSNDKDVWDEWLSQSDATSFDAFVQLAIEGEVIMGKVIGVREPLATYLSELDKFRFVAKEGRVKVGFCSSLDIPVLDSEDAEELTKVLNEAALPIIKQIADRKLAEYLRAADINKTTGNWINRLS